MRGRTPLRSSAGPGHAATNRRRSDDGGERVEKRRRTHEGTSGMSWTAWGGMQQHAEHLLAPHNGKAPIEMMLNEYVASHSSPLRQTSAYSSAGHMISRGYQRFR